jgi:hypothetical protein
MAVHFDISSAVNPDRQALLIWSKLPPQRAQYPDFEQLLYALPYSKRRNDNDGSTLATAYIHLDVARNGSKGLYLKLNTSGGTTGPHQFTFLSKKGEEGYAAANCFGWEQARDVIVDYMDLSEKPKHLFNLV